MNAFPLPETDASGDEYAKALTHADWSSFDAERDLPGLRDALRELEKREGVTEAHRIATAELRERGARLAHPHAHECPVSSHALSPDGKYLAVGSPADFFATETGTLQVWDVAGGRCVNALEGPEGLGWGGYGRCVQWSADSRALVMNFDTSLIGRWDPFGENPGPEADVSAGGLNGASRPVGFATLPDAATVFIAQGDWDVSPGNRVWGGLAAVNENYYDAPFGHKEMREPQWMTNPPAHARDLLGGSIVSPESMTVSADGRWLWGIGDLMAPGDATPPRPGAAFGIDLVARRLEWLRPIDFSARHNHRCSGVSSDERRLACHTDTSVLFLDPGSGELLTEFPALPGEPRPTWVGAGASRLMWESAGPRLAEFTAAAVRIFPGSGDPYLLDIALAEASRDQVDLFPFAWAPDRPQFALLTADATVEIWDATDQPQRLSTIEVPDGMTGLFWGAEDVLVATGDGHLYFVRADGEVLGDIPGAPAADDDEDLDEIDFALRDGTGALLYPEGVVVAPAGHEDELDAVLTWAVDRRFAWPLRWGMPEVCEDVDAARASGLVLLPFPVGARHRGDDRKPIGRTNE